MAASKVVRIAAAAAVCVLAVSVSPWSRAAAASSSNRPAATPAVSGPGLVVAFGDSFAAGEGDPSPKGLTGSKCTSSPSAPYCGYDKGTFTDSANAYPAVLAKKLGYRLDDFAISGACASTATANTSQLANCGSSKPSVLEQELPAAQALNLQPSLVTLTIGGNDVNFESCFVTIFGLPEKLLGKSSGCADRSKALSQIHHNVTKVLTQIDALYPGVPIWVTEYPDPLPSAFTGSPKKSLCSQHALIYAAYEGYVKGKSKSAFATFVSNDHNKAGIKYLNSVFARAQKTTNALDDVLDKAIATADGDGIAANAVALNFSSHDMCQDYPGGHAGYLFGPSLKLTGHALGVTKTYKYTASDSCAHPDAGCLAFDPKPIKKEFHGHAASLKISGNINDIPHPTIAGQKAIASQIAADRGPPEIDVAPALAYPWSDAVCGFDPGLYSSLPTDFETTGSSFSAGETVELDTDWASYGDTTLDATGVFDEVNPVGEVPSADLDYYGVYANGDKGSSAESYIELNSDACALQTDDSDGVVTLQWGANGNDPDSDVTLDIDGDDTDYGTTDDYGSGGSTVQFDCPDSGSFDWDVYGTDDGHGEDLDGGPLTQDCTPSADAAGRSHTARTSPPGQFGSAVPDLKSR